MDTLSILVAIGKALFFSALLGTFIGFLALVEGAISDARGGLAVAKRTIIAYIGPYLAINIFKACDYTLTAIGVVGLCGFFVFYYLTIRNWLYYGKGREC